KQLCKTGIEAKWAIISAQQDVGIVVGVGGGIGLSTAETAVGVYELVKNWRETYAALEQLATSPEFRQQFGDNYLKGLEERAAFLTQAYEDAGWQGSVTAGVEGGRFAAELVGVLTAVKGGAQITAKLPAAAKNLVNAIAESPVSGSMSSQLGAVGDLGKLGGVAKGAEVPKNPNPTSALTDAEAGTSSLPKIGSLKGEPELPPKNASPEMVRSIDRQNEAAKSLARAGYDVEQLPNIKKNSANPDLKINGEFADVFSPRTNSPVSVLMTVTEKVEKQAQNIVVNLADSPLTFKQIENALSVKPVDGLKNLYLLKDGQFKVIEVGR
ncbi:hypothetical protein SOJ62_29730, partial [Pseudomonas aeruginosa]